ncbi:MAG: hypothetical protein ACD_81C00019G0003 [uncultured bacterium]|nr:MAG: hypothetical protein ACD_81C00019G0003 [uncultured bacterium]
MVAVLNRTTSLLAVTTYPKFSETSRATALGLVTAIEVQVLVAISPAPPEENLITLSVVALVTYTRLLIGSTVIPVGEENCPTPVPAVGPPRV